MLTLLLTGLDPADPERVLIRKIVNISDGQYAYEETRISKDPERPNPRVHTTISKLNGFDLKEHLSNRELSTRGKFRPLPNVVGFSLYYR